MRFVIMADGKGTRWNNYLGIPKHMAEVKGEALIERTIRLIRELNDEDDVEIIVTSHDKRYEFCGSTRYEPLNNRLEIDRFTDELLIDGMCFLYGDTYYTEASLSKILECEAEDILFFGNEKSIVAVKISNSELFRYHVCRVRQLYLEGALNRCVGWQVYQSFTSQDFNDVISTEKKFIYVDRETRDINTPEEYEVI